MFKTRPTMCVSFANKGKTQIGWVVGQKVLKWVNVNNTPPKGSPYCVLDLNEMTMRSLWLEVYEKYNGDGCA
jgi:hypothetical protein